MSAFRTQEQLAGEIRPIIVNVMNFAKGEGEPALLELRRRPHAVPRVRPRAARPAVRRDLSAARRHQRVARLRRAARRSSTSTGCRAARGAAPLRAALPRPASRCRRRCSQRMLAARTFNQGFATVEYTGLGPRRHRPAPARRGRGPRRRRLRARGACTHRHAARDRHAPPHAAFRPRLLGRRLFGRLLQLSVVGGARRRRLRRLRGGRRHLRPRHGAKAARLHLRGRQPARRRPTPTAPSAAACRRSRRS